MDNIGFVHSAIYLIDTTDWFACQKSIDRFSNEIPVWAVRNGSDNRLKLC